MPKTRKTWFITNSAVSLAVGSLGWGINRTALENLSTTTRIVVLPCDSGSPVIKSMERWDQGLCGMESGCNSPWGERWETSRVTRVTLVLWIGNETLCELFTLRERLLHESALLAEMRTDWRSATDGRTHLCPESSGNSGRTRAGTGMTLEKQRGPPPLCQTDPRSGIPSDGSTSIPPKIENRPQGSVFPEREPPSKRGTCLGSKGEDGAQACPGCVTVNLLDGLCGTQPPYCPFWLWYDTPRERGENTSKPGRQPWVPGSLYAKRGTLPSTPRSPVCLRRPRPSLSLMRPSWSYADGGSHPFSPRSGENGVSP